MRRLFISSFLFILVSNLLIILVIIPAASKIMKVSITIVIERNDPDPSKGGFHRLQQELLRIPQAQWKDYMKGRGSGFEYPVAVKDYHDISFSENQRSRLLAGNTVVIDNGKSVWRRVGDSGHVVGMGPFHEIRSDIRVIILAWVMITLLIVTVLLIWVVIFWRKLWKVSASAVDFGNGDFGVRADIPAWSSLAPLAGAFNSMADRIQALIQSHKELTNAVSHELRTPIARIRFGLEMMGSTPDENKREAYTEGIRNDVNELDDLVSELLIYARFDREAPEFNLEEREIAPWLEDFAESLEPLPVMVEHVCSLEDKGMKACFDTRHMGRAVGNLLQNALRHGNGRVRLTLEQEGRCILIHVDDNGPGIPETERERIFEPFTRLDASRSRDSGGFGLGLAIVRQIAVRHGGTVTVSDSELGGSRFSIKWGIDSAHNRS